MRWAVILSVCVFTTPAFADVGIGAAAGSDDRAILFPIRLSAVIIEPYVGYRETDVEVESVASTSEQLEVGVGIFGLSTRADNLSIYYGARLADVGYESSITVAAPSTGLSTEQSRTEVDGYRIAPAVGFQYTINRVAFGAEIGLAYEKTDQTSVSFGSPSERTEDETSTYANVVFRFFF